jgi:formylmethanofuran dehydrogenase subunit E
VTGTRLGRRNFKLKDYGKMAATFINLSNGKTFRVNIKNFNLKIPDSEDNTLKNALLQMDENSLLAWREVKVNLRADELPGKPQKTVICKVCGEKIFDSKEIHLPEGNVCTACSGTAYYEIS